MRGSLKRQAPFFVPWCNGNTTDFGSVIQGSSPCGTTNQSTQNEKIASLWDVFFRCKMKNQILVFLWQNGTLSFLHSFVCAIR